MKSLTKAGTRAVCAGLAVFAAVGWSCTKQDEPAMNDSPQANGAIAQARSFYESTATSLTKTVADQTVAIKPLPGDMTPLWDRATAAVLSDGTTAWVDVPITAGVTYTAVRDGAHHHEAGEECGHDHEAVQAVQKLTIHTAADGSRQSLIATIVPEPEYQAALNDFSSADGLARFSGFVSWHDLTGKLIRVTKYENGTKTRSAEPTEGNEAAILDVVDNTILIPEGTEVNQAVTKIVTYSSLTSTLLTKGIVPEGACRLCRRADCPAKGDLSKHCNMCGKYDPPQRPDKSECICPRCTICGKTSGCACDFSPEKSVSCEICGRLFCSHWLAWDGADTGTPNKPFISMHESILEHVLGYLFTYNEFQVLRKGCHAIDQNYLSSGYEYLHGMYAYRDNSSQSTAKAQMRSHFIYKMRGFIQTGDLSYFGEGIHPILDTYSELQTRIDMLPYYSYDFKHNTVNGQFVAPYTKNASPAIEAIKFVWSQFRILEPTATDAQIGAVFDKWVATTGGGDLLL